MKKAVFIIPCIMLMLSCAALKPGYKNITDHSERMKHLQYSFPEVYEMYRAGKVNITQMYLYRDRDGEEKVNITYVYI